MTVSHTTYSDLDEVWNNSSILNKSDSKTTSENDEICDLLDEKDKDIASFATEYWGELPNEVSQRNHTTSQRIINKSKNKSIESYDKMEKINDDSNVVYNDYPSLDLILYFFSGILIIFILEQTVQIASNII